MYAEVIIASALPKNYTWSVPIHLQEQIMIGSRVEVNLGKSKKYAGIVKQLHNEKPEFFETKDIINVLDTVPIIFEQQLKLWEWVAAYYMCTEGEVMAAALPAHFKLSSETIIVYNDEFGDDFSLLDHDEYIIAEALLIKKELTLTEVQQLLDTLKGYPVISRLIQKKVCFVWEALKETYSPKKETFVLLNPKLNSEEKLSELLNSWAKAPKQLELLLAYLHLLKTEGEVIKSQLLKKSGAADAQFKGLVEKNILQIEKRNVDRIRVQPKNIQIDFELTQPQITALENLQAKLLEKDICLLHGVTASGKTLLYIKLIEEQIKQDKQVLYLLPEIALTSQIIRRLQKHFGGHVGVYHSRFSQNERVEIWNKVKSGELKVVLGARSAIFLPYQSLGLIVCDEEHDTSFKQQDPAPRYSGRDAAIFLASMFSAKVLLGSATPSLESYFNATTGKYGLVELLQRYGNEQLPAIEFIDTRKELTKDKSKAMLTPQLIAAMNEVLARGKQIILFQNRRGYDPYQICTTCGWIPQCRHCDVSLTFHKLNNKLSCHYCGSSYPPVHSCVACGNHQFAQRNFGTEKIEELLQETFPNNRVARMDVDALRGKHAHDELIRQFENGRVDILVGTQMLVKGLDFENVDLVGVLDADGLLHFTDFRVNERAFQLIEQVSGRAGRKLNVNSDGTSLAKVFIQTVQPTHPLLVHAKNHAYQAMLADELDKRKQFFYPPFSRLIQLSFKHKSKEIVESAARNFAASLQAAYGDYMIGPAAPAIKRVRNQFLMDILLKLPRNSKILMDCKATILNQIALLHQNINYRSVIVVPDVDVI